MLARQSCFVTFACLILVIVCLYQQPSAALWQYCAFLSALLFLGTLSLYRLSCQPLIFSLGQKGVVELLPSHLYMLTSGSRIGWFGCWLHLYTLNNQSNQVKRFFIFKDSMSRRDYTRLCRYILRFKQQGSFQDTMS
ncbi:protein YgfX [Thalassotalea sediminis]|uniref:protein YgfX n=1 Tax=Thalassotalea sediminis TaxID=1759089 RepID=UPI003305FBCD